MMRSHSIKQAQNVRDEFIRQTGVIALRRQNASAEAATPVDTGLDIGRLRFRYSIEGDNPPWRPLHAFDDGRKVYIEFPHGIAQGEMPPLFIIGPEGKTSELVNYIGCAAIT